MGEPVKFMFDAEFDRAVEPEPSALEETVTALNAEHATALEAARTEAHAEGFNDGQQAALETVEAEIHTLMKHLVESTATLAQAVHADATANKEFALRLAVATAEKLAGELIHRYPTGEIEALLATCLRSIPAQTKIIVRVAPNMQDQLRVRIEEIAQDFGFSGMISVRGSQDVDIADCRIEWADGGMDKNRAELMAEINTALDAYFNSPQGSESQFSPLPSKNLATPYQDGGAVTEDGTTHITTTPQQDQTEPHGSRSDGTTTAREPS